MIVENEIDGIVAISEDRDISNAPSCDINSRIRSKVS